MWEYLSNGQRFGSWLAQAASSGPVLQSLLAIGLQTMQFALAPLGVASLFFWLLAAERTWLSKYGPVRLALTRLGQISYSLFLTHAPIIWSGEIVLSRLAGRPIDLSPAWILLRVVVYLPVCLVTAWVFHQLCEKPFHSVLERRPTRLQSELPGGCPPAATQRRQAA
jgi:peptidoglycan/LPS O-acetylase OafA/YrhL